MFATLLESRAARTRRPGSAAASVLLHGALVAGAVALTATGPADAGVLPVSAPRDTIVYVPVHRPSDGTTRATGSGAASPADPAAPTPPAIDIPAIDCCTDRKNLWEGPLPADTLIAASGTGLARGSRGGSGADVGGVVGEFEADRAPHVLGVAPEPRYPDALRAAGITGRVVVQLVVDTLGRAEPGVEVVQGERPEFVEAVRAALARFRFTPGEAGGRKVRTRVEIPFEFTLR